MFIIDIDNKTYKFNNRITLEELAKQLNVKALAAKVNNRLRELTYYINSDSVVEFIDLSDTEGVRIYQTTLRFLLVKAINNLFPNKQVRFAHHVSRSFLCIINDLVIDDENLFKIKEELNRIISLDLDITRVRMTKEEASVIYNREYYLDKIDVLKYRSEELVNMYKCGDYYNYMYNYLLPRTSYITDFNLIKYESGFLVQYPRSESKGAIPEFEDSLSLSKMIQDAYLWSKTCKISNIASMNEFTNDREFVDFVNMCETKHNNMLSDLGLIIKGRIKDVKIIAIAGPSSSGKTTFSNRLRVELMSRGIFPLMISCDDYYLNREDTPLDEDGKPDFEHIEAIDLKFFNEQLSDLINGKEVTLPVFNFKTGLREKGKTVKLEKNQPIIIEGIHALNERLTSSIERKNKFKIFISPFPQINIDNHNPIMVTDIRMLRRIVRDNLFRKTSPEKTFAMWPSVRRGEFRWIYPWQDEADYVYNTELTYELMVMKKYALPALREIENDSPYYIEANRLIKFLKWIKDIDDRYVPCNSILREFIGGSCFYEYNE